MDDVLMRIGEIAAFFGVSALGCNPQATQRLDFAPRPARVEDPFLWILWKNKLIQGIR